MRKSSSKSSTEPNQLSIIWMCSQRTTIRMLSPSKSTSNTSNDSRPSTPYAKSWNKIQIPKRTKETTMVKRKRESAFKRGIQQPATAMKMSSQSAAVAIRLVTKQLVVGKIRKMRINVRKDTASNVKIRPNAATKPTSPWSKWASWWKKNLEVWPRTRLWKKERLLTKVVAANRKPRARTFSKMVSVTIDKKLTFIHWPDIHIV